MFDKYRSGDVLLAFNKGVKEGATHMFVMRQHMGCSGGKNEYCERTYYVMQGQDKDREVSKQEGILLEVHDLSKPNIFNNRKEGVREFLESM